MLVSFLGAKLWAIAAVVVSVAAVVVATAALIAAFRRSSRKAVFGAALALLLSGVTAALGWFGAGSAFDHPALADVAACTVNEGGYTIRWTDAAPIVIESRADVRRGTVVFLALAGVPFLVALAASAVAVSKLRRSGSIRPIDGAVTAGAGLLALAGLCACSYQLRDPVTAANAAVRSNAFAAVIAVHERDDCDPCGLIEDAAGYLGWDALEQAVPAVRARAIRCVDERLRTIDGKGAAKRACCGNAELAAVAEYLNAAAERSPEWRQRELDRLSHSPLLVDEGQRARVAGMTR